ncbi:hypothetical protein F0U44_11650 [Nocardioides humilatus]|uniref:Uncharacterized protein n=1 Tax=Nocardioides humilatus TaxID=2607660 RepID=A0A5B1LFJ3_9ACTN|nr:hypothetical protein [Nocardioides humilatus]KAA1419104.1 hypothetical protein F0U44_11650 [Nocardioides humilatus]
MAANHTLDERLFQSLLDSELNAAQTYLAVDLCRQVVSIVLDLDMPHRGRAARSAAQLMLSESVPDLDEEMRNNLARLCEVAVVIGF